MKRYISALVCIALLCSALCGCSFELPGGEKKENAIYSAIRDGLESIEGGAAETVQPLASGSFFAETWHDDISYEDMEYVYYELSDFEPYARAIEEAAENGCTAEELELANTDALWQLYYLDTLTGLADIAYDRDPNNAETAEESLRISSVYSAVYDRYLTAMQKAAQCARPALGEIYYDWQISLFESYVPDSDVQVELNDRESVLIQQYYSLVSAAEPDSNAIAEAFVELVGIRNETARSAGYDSYADYAYQNFYYRSYTPEESQRLWTTASQRFVPLSEKYSPEIDEESSRLYFSGEVDCSPQAILDSMAYCLPRMSAELEHAFDYMLEYGLYDIEPSDSKINSGYTIDLYFYNEPFIFNCPYNSYYDYTDMFHEFGHFVNAFYTENEIIFGAEDNDLAELQSQGMEVMFMLFYPEIFGEENGGIIMRDVLMTLVSSVIDGVLYDEFQQRVYAEPELTPERVSGIYAEVCDKYGREAYGGGDDGWIYISHNFDHPFYYISYAISAISALELFVLSQDDPEAAMEKYLTAAAMDLEIYYFTDALEEIGLGDVFSTRCGMETAGGLDEFFAA